jgi:hypothetical protein
LDWNQKAYIRKLLIKKEYEYILEKLLILTKEINSLIKFTKEKLTI